jgi:hypothetical protein
MATEKPKRKRTTRAKKTANQVVKVTEQDFPIPSGAREIEDPNFLANEFNDGRSGPPPSQGDVLGISTPTGGNPILLLYKGATKIEEWGPRGNRSMAEAMAEAEISAENTALSNPRVSIRGDHMKRVIKQRAHRFLYGMGRPGLSPLEFGTLLGFAALIFGVIFVLALVYAP